MRKLLPFLFLAIILLAGLDLRAQSEAEKLDLPGDNLNLYAVMRLFQDSETLEGFERKLNDEESEVNNLDLDGDGNTDYIRVSDQVSGNLHSISLRIAVNEQEEQDVAVFFVEKKDDGQVLIQLVGDEDLYGKDYIIEPNDGPGNAQETPNPGYNANRQPSPAVSNTTYVVSSWPVVRYIFVPQYVVWHSPWRYRYYPSYWRPWRTRYWHYYYGYHYHWHSYYNGHFRRWNSFRNPVWYNHYYGGNFRSRSVVVRTRYTRGDYRATYSRPSSAREGSALFAKRNPRVPARKDRLPSFDNTGRPIVARPSVTRPGARPGTGRPSTGTSRPSARPVTPRPSVERPGTTRPAVERPGSTRPAVERPGNTRPAVERPIRERPAETRPATGRPSGDRQGTSRPATTRPARESAKPASSRENKPREGAEPRRN